MSRETAKRARRVLKQVTPKVTPIGTEIILPNTSGDHVRGIKRAAPVDAKDLVNKEYVDSDTHDATYLKLDASNDPITEDITFDKNIMIGKANEDHFIYFYSGGSPTTRHIKWDEGSSRFEINKSFECVGSYTCQGAINAQGNIISSLGDIFTGVAGGDLWLGNSTQANASFQAYANGNLIAKGTTTLGSTGQLTVDASGNLEIAGDINIKGPHILHFDNPAVKIEKIGTTLKLSGVNDVSISTTSYSIRLIEFNATLEPLTADTISLGTNARKFKNLYLSGIANLKEIFNNNTGGELKISTEDAPVNVDGEDINITAGDGGNWSGVTVGNGASINITAGKGGDNMAPPGGAAGDVAITGGLGANVGGGSGAGGKVTAGGGNEQIGGNVTLTVGQGQGDGIIKFVGDETLTLNLETANTAIFATTSGITNISYSAINITTTGLITTGNLDVDTLNLNTNVISDSTGTISFDNDNLETTGTIETSKSKLTALGGYAIKLTNKTGANTVQGQLVNVYTATAIDDAFKTVDASDEDIIGIVLDAGVADGSEAWIVISGIADVLMDAGGSARGDRIISSATAGSGDVWNVGGAIITHFMEIGHCIESRGASAGLARCVLHFN